MAARRQLKQAVKRSKTAKEFSAKNVAAGELEAEAEQQALIEEHLPPLGLTFLILLCSGFLLVFALRDFLSTGKNIGGSYDEAMLMFTKSTDWFEDARGWKSTQGGFSAIQAVTTDENNMGGFFVRKLAGGAAAAVQIQKILPLLYHESGAQWSNGHFRPLLWTAVIANMATVAFYGSYYENLTDANVWELPLAFCGALMIETFGILYYLFCSRKTKRGPAVAMPEGKTPNSPVSNIATRTVLIVSTVIGVIAGRDLFFPGKIIDIIPRDDIYLEWTNAFLHSPPEGSPEYVDQGLEAPLYIGDKFVGQLAALNVLILCLYKFVVAVFVRYGSDGRGIPASKMIWKGSCIGDAIVLACVRFFTPAAGSASLDLRWHLVMLAYEACILGLYGFF